MIWRIVLILLVLAGSAHAFDLAVVVGDDTTYASANVFNRDVRVFFNEQFSYTVHVISDDSALAVADWSTYDGILILGAENGDLSELADMAIPILSMSNTESLNMADAIGYIGVGQTFLMVKEVADHFTVNYSMDTLWLGHAGGTGTTALQVLAGGVQAVWNPTTLYGKDSAAVAVAETGATLTVGTAVARRAIVGVFYSGTVSGEYTTQNTCHPWELLGNVSAWVYGDTLNATWWSKVCFVDKLESQACWGENGSDGFITYTGLRLCIDPSVTGKFGDGCAWVRLTPEALATKINPHFTTVEACSLNWHISEAAIDNGSSSYDFDVKSHRIIVDTKWHGPPLSGGGNYPDSTWVTRTCVVHGPDSVTWSDTNLVAGVDFDPEVGDSLRLTYTETGTGDSLWLTIPASWLTLWQADSADNNGVVYVAYVAEDNYCVDTYCDVEMSRSGNYNDQWPDAGGTFVWWVTTSATTGWTGDDVTPSIKTGNYLTGADGISDASVFQRTDGDDSTFFQRWEYLVGIGSGMEAYLDEMLYFGCWNSLYVSGPDMPCNDYLPNDNQYGRKHQMITGGAVGEDYWMHYHDNTTVSGNTITGTGSMVVTDGDSASRVTHYTSAWGGNTYTNPTRTIFNFTDADARTAYTNFIQVLFGDSSDSWFPGKTVEGDSHYVALYLDNFDSLRLQSFTASVGGAVIELDSQLVNSTGAVNDYWAAQKIWLAELRAGVDPIFADSLQIGINVGSGSWCYDYIYGVPRGTMLNFEFGFDLLQVKGATGSEWTIDSLAVWDSTGCARGITFFYCAAPWPQQSTYRNSVWEYHGFSTAAWSVYNRMAFYYSVRSDSSLLYCMPAFDGAYYKGYAFDGHSTIYYDWDAKNYAFEAADFDTMSWQDCFMRNIGVALAMPELDTSYFYQYPAGGDGHTAKVFKREYDSAYVFVRPMDDADVVWGKRADSLGLTMTVELPDTCKLLLPDNTLTDSAFVWYEMNPGDGFVFIKATEQAEPPVSSGPYLILRR